MANGKTGRTESLNDWMAAFTRIGNALGLEGRFPVHFGYEQIEQRARDTVARMDSLAQLLDEEERGR